MRIVTVWCPCCVVFSAALLSPSGCRDANHSAASAESSMLRPATATGTVGTGLLDFIISAETQEIIRHYGADRCGKPSFTPLAIRE